MVSAGKSGTEGAPKEQVWALDFDGVVCDSVGESSLSAWKAALKKWPEVFGTPEAEAKKEAVLEGMRQVRPVVETGYENLVQVRCLLEGVSPAAILADWHHLLPEYMSKWGLDRSELVELFGGTRDAWIRDDLPGWLEPNRIYPGVPAVMHRLMQRHELYIVTTKQERFTDALLRDKAQVALPLDRIFSQTVSGAPKSEVLQMLAARHRGAACHFVEDKLSTLEKVCKIADLESWQLYLVDWGYNTEAERQRAEANPRINLLSLDTLAAATGTA